MQVSRISATLWGAALMLVVAWAHADSILPNLPPAKEKADPVNQCVEPIQEMRREHMEMLEEHRDDTLRRGIRTRQHSLSACVNCHVQPRQDGTFPAFDSPDHFCNVCHQYVGVRIGCFECHSDKPQTEIRPFSLKLPDAKVGVLSHVNFLMSSTVAESKP